ncbi:MAG: glycosyltransferase family 2 protein [Elusimicrobiota bacterium]
MGALRRKPDITALVTTYNRLPYLRLALDSIARQTLAPSQVVIVDGGSDDGTAAWLKKSAPRRSVVVRLKGNPGAAALMNAGLALARGRHVAFLESDDYWLPRHLESLLSGFKRPEVQVVRGGFLTVDARGAVLDVVEADGRWAQRLPSRVPGKAGLEAELFGRLTGTRLPVFLSIAMFRRRAFETLGAFSNSFRWLGSEMDLFLRAGRAWGPRAFGFVEEISAAHRFHPGQLTDLPWEMLGAGACGGLTPRQRESFLDWACFGRRLRSGRRR